MRQSALDYIVNPENFEVIMGRNLDIIDMSSSLLLEILGNDAISIHDDSSLNEEKLFQIGWGNIHTKTDEEFATFLPKLLKAVHLPLVSEEFLSNLTRKVDGCKDAIGLIEEAELQKSEIASFKATPEKPEINDNTRWKMARHILDFDDSLFDSRVCKVSVRCHGLLRGLNNKWYGTPLFINGFAFCLHATIENECDNEQTVRYLVAYLYCLSELSSQRVECGYTFHLVPRPGREILYYPRFSCGSGNLSSVFDGDNDTVRKQMKNLTDLVADFYHEETDSCKVITEIKYVEPIVDSESESEAQSEAEAEAENAESDSENAESEYENAESEAEAQSEARSEARSESEAESEAEAEAEAESQSEAEVENAEAESENAEAESEAHSESNEN